MELWTKSSALSAGISGSIGNGILGEYFPERQYNLLNPKRTRKRPKFQPCIHVLAVLQMVNGGTNGVGKKDNSIL